MADITMCTGTGCRARNHCYRFGATPMQMQSYFANVPGADKKCVYYSKKDYSNMMYSVIEPTLDDANTASQEELEAAGEIMSRLKNNHDNSDYYVVPSIEVS